LFESVIVILLLGILAAYVAPKAFNSSAMTLDAQARALASDLQRAQILATTTGQTVLVCANASAYAVQIGGSCPATLPVQSSATQPVVVALEKGATFSPTLPTLVYSSNGQPNAPASFQIRDAGLTSSFTVSVAALSGLVGLAKP
jgi:type II secretory pathway pseudopilin PulG